MDDAVLNPQFDIAGSRRPAMALGVTSIAERQRRRKLDVLHRTKVEIEAGVTGRFPEWSVEAGEQIDFVFAWIGRLGIVGFVGRPGDGWAGVAEDGQLEMISITGDHLSMLKGDHVQNLAQLIDARAGG